MPMTQPHTLRVGLCQFPGTPDRAHNHATCRNFVQQAVDQGAQFLVLPVRACVRACAQMRRRMTAADLLEWDGMDGWID